jgi:hypothetical protein
MTTGMTNEEHMRWGCLGMVAVIALVLLFFATQVGADVRERPSDYFAVAANMGLPGTYTDAQEIAAHNVVAQRLADAEVTMVRMRALRWREVQPANPRSSKARIDWGKWPAVYDAYTSRGIKIVVPFLDTPGWATTGAEGTGAPNLRAWRTFVTSAARRFPGVYAWEVWNEPDLEQFFTGTPAQYTAMHRVAYAAIKRQGGTVWGPTMTGHYLFDGVDAGWTQVGRDALSGALPVDAFAFHDYGTFEAKMAHAAEALERSVKPVVVTETNVTWDRTVSTNLSPEEVAVELERIYLGYLYLGVDSVFWWPAVDTWGRGYP